MHRHPSADRRSHYYTGPAGVTLSKNHKMIEEAGSTGAQVLHQYRLQVYSQLYVIMNTCTEITPVSEGLKMKRYTGTY